MSSSSSGTKAEACLQRFRTRWAQEVERGLQDFDSRREFLLAELRTLLSPDSLMPRLSIIPEIEALIRPHVDEVVHGIESRVAPLRETLAAELSEAVGAQLNHAAGTAPALASISASAATVAGSNLQTIAWTVSVVSTSANIIELSSLRFAEIILQWLCRKLPFGGRLVSALGTSIISTISAFKKLRKVTRLVHIGFWFMFVLERLAPSARNWLLNNKLPEGVQQAMDEVRRCLQQQFDEQAAAIERQSRALLETMQQEPGPHASP